jgi:hypothetical protein
MGRVMVSSRVRLWGGLWLVVGLGYGEGYG